MLSCSMKKTMFIDEYQLEELIEYATTHKPTNQESKS